MLHDAVADRWSAHGRALRLTLHRVQVDGRIAVAIPATVESGVRTRDRDQCQRWSGRSTWTSRA